jgi:hypothetical protein
MFQADSERSASSEKFIKAKEWRPDFAIEVKREGKLWMVFSPALRGNLSCGRSLYEAMQNWIVANVTLYTLMQIEVGNGKEPTEQFKAYERILSSGQGTLHSIQADASNCERTNEEPDKDSA